MNYRIGLDIGIASVGWAVLEEDESGDIKRIADLGARTFNPAENLKDGSSLTVERRQARGARRTLRRKKARIEKAKKLVLRCLLSQDNKYKVDFNLLYENKENIYELRSKALDEKISNEQLAKILLAILKHRGYKSNSKSEEVKDKESGKVLSALSNHTKRMNEKSWRTIGEYVFKDKEVFYELVGEREIFVARNKSGNYKNTFKRSELEKEIRIILEKQKEFGNKDITKDFEDKYLEIFNSQLDFDSGPNEPSPYRSLYKVGDCTFEPNEKRAPKASWTFSDYSFLQKVNNLKIVDEANNTYQVTNQNLIDLKKYFQSKKDISFKNIRQILKLDEKFKFNYLDYRKKERRDKKGNILPEKDPEETRFMANPSYEILKTLGVEKKDFNVELVDNIAYCLAMFKTDDNRLNAFEDLKIDISEEVKNELLKLSVSKFGFLSIKAMKKILPFFEKGERYDIACLSAGYNHSQFSSQKSKKINPNSEEIKNELAVLTSPVVKRSVSQTIKVVNAIINKYGSPKAINIELTREMSKNWEDRQKIKKNQEEREKRNQEYVNVLKENGILKPTGQEIIKYRLYEEQFGKCAYSQKSLEAEFGNLKNLLQNNNTQIDHIIPFSKCFDDSLNNKVLVLTSENQNKKNRLPYEYFGYDEERWNKFVDYVNSLNISIKKKQNLFKKSISEEEEKELNSRALNDTKHASKFMMNLFENHLEFSQFAGKKPVRAVNGSMTSYLRKIWGLSKHRFESDKHHIQDAVVVACTNNGMIQKVSRFLQLNKHENLDNGRVYCKETGEIFNSEREYYAQVGIKYPFHHFVTELTLLLADDIDFMKNELQKIGWEEQELKNLKKVFISRMPTKKLKGKIHEDTYKSNKLTDDKSKIYTVKTSITKLKLNDNDEIEGYPEKYKESDKLLYNALKNKLLEIKQKVLANEIELKSKTLGELAFSQGFFKPSKNGGVGNPVKTVKIQSVSNGGVVLNRGFVENSNIIRTDIFYKNDKYYVIPVYTSDFYKKELPNKVITIGKLRENWDEIDDTYEFKFSLFPNDLIYIRKNTKSDESISGFYYFNSLDSSDGRIKLFSHDKSKEFRVTTKTNVNIFEKYQVDILGNITKVNFETRQNFNNIK